MTFGSSFLKNTAAAISDTRNPASVVNCTPIERSTMPPIKAPDPIPRL